MVRSIRDNLDCLFRARCPGRGKALRSIALLSVLFLGLLPIIPLNAQTTASVETLLDSVILPSFPDGLAVSGNTVAVNRGNALDLFDMTSPAGVTEAAKTLSGLADGIPATIDAVIAAGNLFYLRSGTSIVAVDPSDPANPTVTAVVENLNTTTGKLAFIDDFLVVADGNFVKFFDASNRTSLTLVSDSQKLASILAFGVAPGRVYVLEANRLGAFGLTAVTNGDGNGGGATSDPTGGLNGTVTNSNTTEPIEGAIVSIADAGVSTRTDAAGVYSFSGLTPGMVSLNVARVDFQVAQASEATISADATASQDVSLNPVLQNGSITGAVSSSTGGVIEGASVRVGETTLSAVTNNEGVYFIQGVPPGSVTLAIDARGFTPSMVSDVAVEANAAATANATLEPLLSSIRGFVTDAFDGAPVVGALVSITGSESAATTDDAGAYEISGLATGTVSLEIEAEGFGSVQQEVTVTGGIDREVNIDVAPLRSGPLRISSGGFAESPLTFSADAGGAVTMRAEVDGGAGDVEVEAFFRSMGITDATGELSLGMMTALDERNFELVIGNLPANTLPPGDFIGVVFVARDGNGETATWPALNVPASPVESSNE